MAWSGLKVSRFGHQKRSSLLAESMVRGPKIVTFSAVPSRSDSAKLPLAETFDSAPAITPSDSESKRDVKSVWTSVSGVAGGSIFILAAAIMRTSIGFGRGSGTLGSASVFAWHSASSCTWLCGATAAQSTPLRVRTLQARLAVLAVKPDMRARNFVSSPFFTSTVKASLLAKSLGLAPRAAA
jgi:hypothetical protein